MITVTLFILWMSFIALPASVSSPSNFIYPYRGLLIAFPFIIAAFIIIFNSWLYKFNWYKKLICDFDGHIHPNQNYNPSALTRYPYPCDGNRLRCNKHLKKGT